MYCQIIERLYFPLAEMKFVCGRVFSLVSKTNKGGNLLNPYLLPGFLSKPLNKLPYQKNKKSYEDNSANTVNKSMNK